MQAVKHGQSIRKTSVHFQVPRSMLHEHLTGKRMENAVLGKSPKLNEEQEKSLEDFCKERASKGLGLSSKDVRLAAAKLGREAGQPTKWLKLFKQRNGLTLRTPEATTAYRHQGMNPAKIIEFFVELTDL